MKKEFESEKGTIYGLEAGDKFTATTAHPFEVTSGEYPSWLLKSKVDDEEVTVRLTRKQNQVLSEVKDVTGHEFECYSYDTKHRKGCVGLRDLTVDNEVKAKIKEWINSNAEEEDIIHTLTTKYNFSDKKAYFFYKTVKDDGKKTLD